jgi:hypothetical protein
MRISLFKPSSLTGVAIVTALALGLTGGISAYAVDGSDLSGESVELDLSGIDEDLLGTVYVFGDEVYSSDLEPVATLDEYVEVFEDAGADVVSADVPSADAVASVGGNSSGFTVQRASLVRPKFEAPGCSGHDANRSLQAFTRTAKGGAKRGIGELRCGNSSWGWRHIAEGHKGDYSKIGAPSGKSWGTFAKWCIGQTLGSPSSATYQKSNATYPYQAPVQIWNNGTLQKTYQNRVSVRTSDWVIVTSYISRA